MVDTGIHINMSKLARPYNIVLCGPYGAGKTTLARLISAITGGCMTQELVGTTQGGNDLISDLIDEKISPIKYEEKLRNHFANVTKSNMQMISNASVNDARRLAANIKERNIKFSDKFKLTEDPAKLADELTEIQKKSGSRIATGGGRVNVTDDIRQRASENKLVNTVLGEALSGSQDLLDKSLWEGLINDLWGGDKTKLRVWDGDYVTMATSNVAISKDGAAEKELVDQITRVSRYLSTGEYGFQPHPAAAYHCLCVNDEFSLFHILEAVRADLLRLRTRESSRMRSDALPCRYVILTVPNEVIRNRIQYRLRIADNKIKDNLEIIQKMSNKLYDLFCISHWQRAGTESSEWLARAHLGCTLCDLQLEPSDIQGGISYVSSSPREALEGKPTSPSSEFLGKSHESSGGLGCVDTVFSQSIPMLSKKESEKEAQPSPLTPIYAQRNPTLSQISKVTPSESRKSQSVNYKWGSKMNQRFMEYLRDHPGHRDAKPKSKGYPVFPKE